MNTAGTFQPDRKLGQILIDLTYLDKDTVSDALVTQKQVQVKSGRHLKLGELLLFSQMITLKQLQTALSMQVNRAAQSQMDSWESFKSHRRRQAAAQNVNDEEKSLVNKVKNFFGRSK